MKIKEITTVLLLTGWILRRSTFCFKKIYNNGKKRAKPKI